MTKLGSEDHVEQASLKLLEELGWETHNAQAEAPGDIGRQDKSEPYLTERLRDALTRFNPDLAPNAIDAAVEELTKDRSTMSAVKANREIWELLRNGATVTNIAPNGKRESRNARYVDWTNSANNDLLAVSQLQMHGETYKCRADIVLFINGIPLVLVELKAPGINVKNAFDDNIRMYRSSVGQFFTPNGFIVISNGFDSRLGATFAPWEHFYEWKKIDNENETPNVSLETMLRATCAPQRVLDLIENFTTFTETSGGLIKIVARNHQYLGVNNAVESIYTAKENDGKLGVFWHTQGSGKSLSMLWFTQKVLRKQPGNWTFVIVTDRRELDVQLYANFTDSGALTGGVETHAQSSQQLRDLLGENHRYVFTLIHKFLPPTKGAAMPVLSERDDIIVITDEAHRSQYDTLAGNMRQALPNASFLGFTGTPLIDGEDQATRQVFGDYISTYNFTDSIKDGSTVPLYYENRIPEIQLTNDNFDKELEDLLEKADLDDAQTAAVARRFSKQLQLIKRPQRLEAIATDLVEHFSTRGYLGKAMFVAVDKETALRMHGLVSKKWAQRITELQTQAAKLDGQAKVDLEKTIVWMQETDMAVMVSAAQNEVADMDALGLDIRPHRERIVRGDLDNKFKDPTDPFRLVFVCAMWLTGFDAPSTSTLYLDKPMRNHTLMQTIARANRVFKGKGSGLIVDYIGVFRNLEQALAIYATGDAPGPRDTADSAGIDGSGATEPGVVDSPIKPTSELITEFLESLDLVEQYLAGLGIDVSAVNGAAGGEQGLGFVAFLANAVEAVRTDEQTRRKFVALSNSIQRQFKSLMPAPQATANTHRVSVIKAIANVVANSAEKPDFSDVMENVSALLDRSVGTREYVIQTLTEQKALLDLNTINWEQLSADLGDTPRQTVATAAEILEQEIDVAIRRNPTLAHLADKFRDLIENYNTGTLNAEELMRRLAELAASLDDHQQRIVKDGLTEAELAIFDLLTKPEPELTEEETDQVRNAAKELLDKVTDVLVLDWQRKDNTKSLVRKTIRDTLDATLPDPYDRNIFDNKSQQVFEHLCISFGNDGTSIYDAVGKDKTVSALQAPARIEEITQAHLTHAQTDPVLFQKLCDLVGLEA